ncbi:MAG: hypothetical protein HRT94_04660 [Alphaproteobacteria bacterium]|nr:hypothetical protein [Alphaproteobacteria bacterium]
MGAGSLRRVSAGRSFNSIRAELIGSDLDELFYYFFHIDERDDSPETFQYQWNKLGSFSWNPKQIANIIGRIGDHVEFLDECEPDHAQELRRIMNRSWHQWEEPALNAIDRFQPRHLSMTIQAHRQLGFVPTPEFKRHWLRAARKTAKQYRPSHFTGQIHDAASLGVFLPQTAFTNLLDRVSTSSDFLRGRQRTTLLWSLAIHDAMRPLPECKEIAELLRPHIQIRRFDVAQQKMLHDAEKYFGWEPTVDNPVREETRSGYEKDFARALRRAGIETRKEEGRIPGFNNAIDITGTLNGTDVDIEVDGSTHFNQIAGVPQSLNPPYKGKDLLRSRRLQQAAPEARILRVPHTVADIIMGKGVGRSYSKERRGEIARHFIQKVTEQPAGLFKAAIKSVNDEGDFVLAHLIKPQRARSRHTP